MKTLNGESVPSIGLGTYKLDSIENALKVGYRLFDCAQVYHNQHVIGPQLKSVSRDQLFIISKVWPNMLSRGLPKLSAKKSLEELQINSFDLLLVHWPIVFEKSEKDFPLDENERIIINKETKLEDVWREFLQLKDEGVARYVGVSNFNKEQLTSLKDSCNYWPKVNQIESHLLFQNQDLIDFCFEKEIQIQSYCPLARGKALQLSSVKRLSKRYDVTESQICLRFGIQRKLQLIPKSNSYQRLVENLNVFGFELTEEEMNELRKEDKNERISCFDKYGIKETKNYPF